MDITEKQIWQIIPIIGAGFSLFAIVSNIVVHGPAKTYQGDLLSPTGVIVFLSVTAIVFLYLIFFPTKIFLYPIIGIGHGLLNIVDGGNIIGLMLYTLGCAFALKSGFFKRRAQAKFFLLVLLILGAMLTQIRYGIAYFVQTLLNIGIIAVIFLMFWFLFRAYLGELLPNRTAIERIDLAKYDLQERDYDFIRQILQNKKYDAIASSHKISESAVKQRMSLVYRKFGISNRTEFLIMASKTQIIFPDAKN